MGLKFFLVGIFPVNFFFLVVDSMIQSNSVTATP